MKFSGTWVSFHTWLVQSVYSMLAGVTSPQRFQSSSLPQGFRVVSAAEPQPTFTRQLWLLACNQLHHLHPSQTPPKAWPVSSLNSFPFGLTQCQFSHVRGQPAAARTEQPPPFPSHRFFNLHHSTSQPGCPVPPQTAHLAAPWPQAIFFIQIFFYFIKIITVNTLIRKIEQVGNMRWDGEI